MHKLAYAALHIAMCYCSLVGFFTYVNNVVDRCVLAGNADGRSAEAKNGVRRFREHVEQPDWPGT